MVKLISIGKHSRQLMGQLSQLLDDATLLAWTEHSKDEIARAEVVAWLAKKIESNTTSRFLLESLRAALLEDLHDSFLSTDECSDKKETSSANWLNSAQFIFLAAAGTLLAICEGFDGIASILGSFTEVPTAIIFAAGIAFSLLSVGIFYGFELVEISKLAGVDFWKSSQLLDVYLEQVEQIEKLREAINDCYADITLDANGRIELQRMLNMLVLRYNALDEAREYYSTALNNLALKVAKLATAVMTAMIFFSGGFFAGQTLALAVAGLFITSVSATFWPIVAASTVVGLAALSLYWFIQRPGLENLVSHWVGLDKDNIDTFAGDDVVTKQKQALHKLQDKVELFDNLNTKIVQLTKFNNTTVHESVHSPVFFKRPRAQSLGDANDHGHAHVLKFA